MGVFLIVLIVIVCLLMAMVILVQNPKGGGLATGFQGAAQIGGVQKTADFLEKATWYLAIALFVLCIFSAKFYGSGVSAGQEEIELEAAPEAGEAEANFDEAQDLGTGEETP